MYRDKDLTEETEEMILKRQKHQIEQLEFYLASQKIQHERQMQLDIPATTSRWRMRPTRRRWVSSEPAHVATGT